MTIANSFVAKASVAFVAIAMAISLVAPAAQAQEDLSDMSFEELLAYVQKLSGDMGGSTSGSCSFTFTAAMGVGATGQQVMDLQKFLNMDPQTRVAASGAGSPGMETSTYGPLTAAAVSNFQVKYRADVLTPLGLVNPTGYFGNSSIAKANALCKGGTVGGDDDDDDDSSSDDLNGGEASLEDFTGNTGDDSDIEEGQEDAPVAEFEFDVEDGDVMVNRIDLAFGAASGNDAGADDDPWDVFDEISIWVDGDKIADMDASDEDEWSDDDPTTDQHTLRFTGLDWVVKEGETGMFTVGVTVAGGVDAADTTPTWYVFVPQEGIRAEDGQGIQNYIGEADASNATITDYDEEVSFDIDEEGGDDELIIGSSSEDPDATTFNVEESQKSDWTNIFTFDLDTDDSTNDIVVDTIVLDVHTPGDTYNSVVSDARLMVGDEEYDDVTVLRGTTATGTLTFDLDKKLVIDAGDEVAVSLELEFLAQSGNYSEGQQVEARSTTTSAWEAEGADDVTVTGSAASELHTLRTEGIQIDLVSTTETLIVNDDASTTDNEGQFKIVFDVTAFESDIYIDKTAASGTTATTSGAMFQIEDSTGTAVLLGSNSAVLTSTADSVGSEFIVEEDETETFTLTVTYDPASSTTGFFQLQLYGVNVDLTAAADMETQQRALPADEFESDPIDI